MSEIVCTVRLTWGEVAYPATVDPSWGATGSMTTTRIQHAATLLPSGKVPIAGGGGSAGFAGSGAELFDGVSGTLDEPRAASTKRSSRSLPDFRRHRSSPIEIGGCEGRSSPSPTSMSSSWR